MTAFFSPCGRFFFPCGRFFFPVGRWAHRSPPPGPQAPSPMDARRARRPDAWAPKNLGGQGLGPQGVWAPRLSCASLKRVGLWAPGFPGAQILRGQASGLPGSLTHGPLDTQKPGRPEAWAPRGAGGCLFSFLPLVVPCGCLCFFSVWLLLWPLFPLVAVLC